MQRVQLVHGSASRSPENTTSGRNVTNETYSLPALLRPITPTAESVYRSTQNFLFAAMDRNQSMWQLAIDATNASSGSTAAGSDIGTGTTCGDDDPGISTPPSNRSRCLRL